MVKHIVCWKIKKGENKSNVIREITRKLLELKDGLEMIVDLQVGTNSPLAPQGNHDIVLVSEFNGFEDLQKYQSHPKHIEAGAFIKQMTEQRVAVDFEF